ncbi:MAG: LysR substrate-binding domain-containing protein [Rhodospirillaceae bacterium]|nr:LysR substrate-binding domain-containing protein [Rhodospirillaceae bacterium]
MNLRQIEAFRAVMMTGGISRAAELMMISQPAASRLVADFERATGLHLFDRAMKRVIPTPEAQLLFREVEAAFVGVDQIKNAAARIREFGAGDLKIASLAALGSTLVPRAIKAFLKDHPRVAVSLQVRTSASVRDMVASGQCDIGLAADEINLTGVVHQVFATPQAVCAVPRNHPLARKETVSPIDLDQAEFVALAPQDTARRRIHQELDKAGVRPRIVVETPYSGTVYACVAEGIGVGLVNPYAINDERTDKVVLKRFEPPVHFRSLLLFPPNRQQSTQVRSFLKHLFACRNKYAKSGTRPRAAKS